jgi:hypothetical protein
VGRIDLADDRFYEIDHAHWSALLDLDDAPSLPFHEDWIPAYRTFTRLARWLQRNDLNDLSPYLLASQARTLRTSLEPDVAFLGVPPTMNARPGADYWDDFADTMRIAIRHIRR